MSGYLFLNVHLTNILSLCTLNGLPCSSLAIFLYLLRQIIESSEKKKAYFTRFTFLYFSIWDCWDVTVRCCRTQSSSKFFTLDFKSWILSSYNQWHYQLCEKCTRSAIKTHSRKQEPQMVLDEIFSWFAEKNKAHFILTIRNGSHLYWIIYIE